MFRLLAGVLAVAALFGAAAADDKDTPALTGTWTRESNGLDIKIEFVNKDTLKVSAFGGENGAVVTCKYTAGKDGRVTIKITDVEEKGSFPSKPPKGVELSFTWKVKGDTATLDDFKGVGKEGELLADAAKPVMEGEYARKKGKQ